MAGPRAVPVEKDQGDRCERKESGPLSGGSGISGGCDALIHDLPGSSIDLIVTDPPFAIDFRAQRLNYNRTGSNVLEGYQEISDNDYEKFSREWMKEAFSRSFSLGQHVRVLRLESFERYPVKP